MYKKLSIVGLIAAVLVGLVMLSDVTKDDALFAHKAYDAVGKPNAELGSFFTVDSHNVESLCSRNETSLRPEAPPGTLTVENRLGKNLSALQAALNLLPGKLAKLLEFELTIDVVGDDFTRTWENLKLASASNEDLNAVTQEILMQDQPCLGEFQESLNSGKTICVVNRVWKRGGMDMPFAISFREKAFAKCSDEPRCGEDANVSAPKCVYSAKVSIWSRAKAAMGLVEVGFVHATPPASMNMSEVRDDASATAADLP